MADESGVLLDISEGKSDSPSEDETCQSPAKMETYHSYLRWASAPGSAVVVGGRAKLAANGNLLISTTRGDSESMRAWLLYIWLTAQEAGFKVNGLSLNTRVEFEVHVGVPAASRHSEAARYVVEGRRLELAEAHLTDWHAVTSIAFMAMLVAVAAPLILTGNGRFLARYFELVIFIAAAAAMVAIYFRYACCHADHALFDGRLAATKFALVGALLWPASVLAAVLLRAAYKIY